MSGVPPVGLWITMRHDIINSPAQGLRGTPRGSRPRAGGPLTKDLPISTAWYIGVSVSYTSTWATPFQAFVKYRFGKTTCNDFAQVVGLCLFQQLFAAYLTQNDFYGDPPR